MSLRRILLAISIMPVLPITGCTEEDDGCCVEPDADLDDAEAVDAEVGHEEEGANSNIIEWVLLDSGSFQMGSDRAEACRQAGGTNCELYDDETPIHEVSIQAFWMARTETTLEHYLLCVDRGECTATRSKGWHPWCNNGYDDRLDHPVNCLSFEQATAFCGWVGGRLPSEAEWEYAARSQGLRRDFPWGDEPPSCDLAIFGPSAFDDGCGRDSTWPVCSKPGGNTEDGLCDMAGNAFEWVRDYYHEDFTGAPTDGSAWEAQGSCEQCSKGVIRGGSAFSPAFALYSTFRDRIVREETDFSQGFRCVRDR